MRWFTLEEIRDVDNFITEHVTNKNCYKNNNPNHNNLGFTINYDWTGIGTTLKVTCNCCNETKDCTDYSAW